MRKSFPFIDCCIKTISKMKLSNGQETKITQKITNYFISKHSGIIQGEVNYNSLIKDFKIPNNLNIDEIELSPNKKIRCDVAYWSESVLNVLELKIFDDRNFEGWHLNKAYCMLLFDYLKGIALEKNKGFSPKTIYWQVVILRNPQEFNDDLVDSHLLNGQWRKKRAPHKYDSPFALSIEAIKRLAENNGCEAQYAKVPNKIASSLKILVVKRNIN